MKIYNYPQGGLSFNGKLFDNVKTAKVLAETDQQCDIHDVLIINGVAYYVCALAGTMNTQNIHAFVKRIENQNFILEDYEPEEMYGEENITCPYCGHVHESFEMDDFGEYECVACGSTFKYEREIEVTYNTYPIKKKEPIRI